MVLHEGALVYHTDVEVVHKRRSATSTEVYEYMKQRADIHIQTSGKCDQVAKKQHKIQKTSRHR